jgi:acetyltransferase
MAPHYLSTLFEPRSVVLVGASEMPEKVGGRLLENLLAGGFKGKLFAVNPKHASVRGVPCVGSIAELPEVPDLAVIATPAATVPGIIDACGAKGIRAAVIISAGFREAGPAGAARELELIEAARHPRRAADGPQLRGASCARRWASTPRSRAARRSRGRWPSCRSRARYARRCSTGRRRWGSASPA